LERDQRAKYVNEEEEDGERQEEEGQEEEEREGEEFNKYSCMILQL
jgi:hypothetical protein